MKVTYNELVGMGTMLNPTYTALQVEREEFCDSISKVGALWYMFRGGYVFRSIEVENITKIELNGVSAICKYYRNGQYPFTCRFVKDCRGVGAGYKDFASLMRDFYLYSKN